MAVLVPEVNIAHVQETPAMRKKILSLLSLAVIPMIKKATDAAAMWQPKMAASLNTEKYLIMPFTKCCLICPWAYNQFFSAALNPNVFCFHAQYTAKNDKIAQTYKNCFNLLGEFIYNEHIINTYNS